MVQRLFGVCVEVGVEVGVEPSRIGLDEQRIHSS